MKGYRLHCKCAVITKSVPSSFKAILRRKRMMTGESVVRSKPKRKKVLNFSTLGKKCHILYSNASRTNQTVKVWCKAPVFLIRKWHTIFTNCCVFFDAYRINICENNLILFLFIIKLSLCVQFLSLQTSLHVQNILMSKIPKSTAYMLVIILVIILCLCNSIK